ncbi:hypothetical protein P8452_44513 [Trifolium repens]|nr:hypothetical protein P8452_44513 [Trifolium repens]
MVAMEMCDHCCMLRQTIAHLCDGVYFSCCTDCGKVLSESTSLKINRSDKIMETRRKTIGVKKTKKKRTTLRQRKLKANCVKEKGKLKA